VHQVGDQTKERMLNFNSTPISSYGSRVDWIMLVKTKELLKVWILRFPLRGRFTLYSRLWDRSVGYVRTNVSKEHRVYILEILYTVS